VAIFTAYPRKVAREKAYKAIAAALARIGKREDDRRRGSWSARRCYAKARNRAIQNDPEEKKYTPHPATWFNGGRYDDDPGEWEISKRKWQRRRARFNRSITLRRRCMSRFSAENFAAAMAFDPKIAAQLADEERRQVVTRKRIWSDGSVFPTLRDRIVFTRVLDPTPEVQAAVGRLKDLLDTPAMIGFDRPRGRGKTYLAAATAESSSKLARTAKYIRAIDWLLMPSSDIPRSRGQERSGHHLTNTPAGSADHRRNSLSGCSDWEIDDVADADRSSYGNVLSTVIISNETSEQFVDGLGRRSHPDG